MRPFRTRWPAALAVMLTAASFAACGGDSDDVVPTSAASPKVLSVQGGLDRPASLSVADLKALPPTTQTVSYGSGAGPQTHTYTGTNLWNLLDQADIQVDAARKNDVLGKYVLATGADGYKAVFSLAELKPDFGNRPSLVVYAEAASGVSSALGTDGPVRVTAPGDVKGGRYVSALTRLDVRDAGSTATGTGGGVTTSFTVSGAVKSPGTFDLAALQALPAVTRTVGANVYRGVSLWDFLNTTTGLVLDPAVKNDVLGKYVVATGSDGYRALIALGEIEPGFGNAPNLIAYEVDGAPLATSGFARLVVPGDTKAGRFVSNLVGIEVLAARPAP